MKALEPISAMPRFYFDITENSRTLADEEGLELGSIEEARREALRALGGIVKDSLPDGDRAEYVIAVRDGRPHPVITAFISLRVERKA